MTTVAKMKRLSKDEKNGILMAACISVVSRDGLDRLTTKRVEAESGISERYIFFNFGSKEGLLRETFAFLDRMVVSFIRNSLRRTEGDKDNGGRLLQLWDDLWEMFADNPERLRFYIRYEYSTYFEDISRNDHNSILVPLFEATKNMFKPDVPHDELMRQAFMMLLTSAMRALNSPISMRDGIRDRSGRQALDAIRSGLAGPTAF